MQPTEPHATGRRGGGTPAAVAASERKDDVPAPRSAGSPRNTCRSSRAANDTANTQVRRRRWNSWSASSDLSHVVFESKVGLTAAAPSAAGLYEWQCGSARWRSSACCRTGRRRRMNRAGNRRSATPAAERPQRDLERRDTRVLDRRRRMKRSICATSQRGETIEVNAAQGHGATEPGEVGKVLAEPQEGHQEVHFQSASSRWVEGVLHRHRAAERRIEPGTSRRRTAGGPVRVRTDQRPGRTAARAPERSDAPIRAPGSADVLNLIPGASAGRLGRVFRRQRRARARRTPGECVRNPEGEAPPRPERRATCMSPSPIPRTRRSAQTQFIARCPTKTRPTGGPALPRASPLAGESQRRDRSASRRTGAIWRSCHSRASPAMTTATRTRRPARRGGLPL